MGLGMLEILVILLVLLLLFGAKKIPGIARAFGRVSNEFHKAKDGNSADEAETDAPDREMPLETDVPTDTQPLIRQSSADTAPQSPKQE